MSSHLYRLGHLAARKAGTFVAAWVVLIALLATAAASLGGAFEEDLTIPGTESQRGLNTLDQRFELLAGTSGQILFVAPEGDTLTEHADEINDVLDEIADVDQVAMVVNPLDEGQEHQIAEDRYGLAQLILDVKLEEIDADTIPALEKAAELPADSALEVHLGGSLFTTTSVALSPTEAIGVVVALVVLAITFGSMIAAGLPILTAVVGVGATMAGVLAVASFATITSTTPTLALMIGLAVGIDYALFIVYRHRTQLARGMAVRDSVARSVATAGSAVIFAGATVVIALAGLAVAQIPFLTTMGMAAAAGVAVAVAVAVTLTPAILAMLGERLRPAPSSRAARRALADPDSPAGSRTMGARWVAAVTRLPWLTALVSVLALAALALPAKDLALALPDNGTKEVGSAPRTTYDLISDAFGEGVNGPLLVTADIITSTDPLALVDSLADEVEAVDGVADVVMATPNPKGDLAVLQIVSEAGQSDLATADLVRDLRAIGPEISEAYGISDWTVTGQTAVTIDVSDRLSAALLPFGLVVVGLSLVLLTIVFRSIAVPIKATLGYLLSVLAAFGAVTMVFEYGWFAEALNVAKVGPVISFLPIILMGVLFGLAMDYEVFLVSRMREEYVHTGDADRAVRVGFIDSARVVTAAAIIMIAVFVAFVPHGDSIMKPMAFGLAVGVFVDAFVVRMTLVPAVMKILGDKAWWLPRTLDRRLPHLDVEGESLAHHVEHEEWVAANGPAVVRLIDVVVNDERHAALNAPTSLVVRPGELSVLASDDSLNRSALLAVAAGRLAPSAGTAMVHGRLLPDEAVAVRRSTAWYATWPGTEALDALLTQRTSAPALVVVDGIDAALHVDEQVADRWAALARLTSAGVAVLAGTTTHAPLPTRTHEVLA